MSDYNQEVLFPFLKETFVGTKQFNKFNNDMMSFKDEALRKIGEIQQEKTIGDAQDKRQKEVLKIHNDALKRNKILSDNEAMRIAKSEVF